MDETRSGFALHFALGAPALGASFTAERVIAEVEADGGDDIWATRVAALLPLLLQRAEQIVGRRHFGAGAPQPADLAQATIERLLVARLRQTDGALASLQDEELKFYALRTLHNLFLDRCTRKRREDLGPAVATEQPTSDPGPEDEVEESRLLGRREAVLNQAAAIFSEQEVTFLLACLEHDSAPAAQRHLGWPPGGPSNASQKKASMVQRLAKKVRALMGPVAEAYR